MDASSFAHWLKNSVVGIIILGAIGSLLAGAVVRLFWRPLTKLGLRLAAGVRSRMTKRAYSHGFIIGSLRGAADPIPVVLYCAFHLGLFLLSTLLSLFCAGVFAIRVAGPSASAVSATDFVLVVLAFLNAYLAYSQFRVLSLGYLTIVVPLRTKGEESFDAKANDDPNPPKT